MSERKCTNCGRGEPDVWFISSSGGWCIACMSSLAKKRTPLASKLLRYEAHQAYKCNVYKRSVYKQRWMERAAGVPEDLLTPLPDR